MNTKWCEDAPSFGEAEYFLYYRGAKQASSWAVAVPQFANTSQKSSLNAGPEATVGCMLAKLQENKTQYTFKDERRDLQHEISIYSSESISFIPALLPFSLP